MKHYLLIEVESESINVEYVQECVELMLNIGYDDAVQSLNDGHGNEDAEAVAGLSWKLEY